MLVLVIILLALAVLVLPMRHAFGVNLAATFLFIVPNGFDVTTYLFILLFFRLSILKFWAKENFKFDQFIILFLFFLFCSILSYLIYQGEGGLEYLRRFFMTILIIFLFVNIYNSTKEIDLFVRYLFIGMLLLSIHLISQTLIPINPFAEATFSRREGRLLPRGFANQYVNSNNMGALLVWGYGIVIGFYTLFYSKYIEKYSRIKKTKVFLYGSVLFMMVALLLGMLGSRTNFIVLILVGLVVLLKISVTKRFVRIVFFSFIFFYTISPLITDSIVGMERLSPNNIFAPLVNRLIDSSDEFEDENDYSRSSLARNGIKLFVNNPIFGVGIGNEAQEMYKADGVRKVSHNTYVSLLSEMGVIGIMFIFVLIGIWISYIKNDFAISVLLMIGVYAAFHNIMLMSIPWLIMSFTKKCYELIEK